MAQMVPLLLLRMKDHLTAIMKDGIAASDDTQADLIKVGRFQENPKDNNIWMAINGGDPDDPTYMDGLVTLEEMDEIGFWTPVREIGGGEAWWRRGSVQLGCFYVKSDLDEEDAMQKAYTIHGRLQAAIKSMLVTDLIDDYGEQATVTPFVIGTTFFESGGPPTKYYWRGKVLWQVLTHKS